MQAFDCIWLRGHGGDISRAGPAQCELHTNADEDAVGRLRHFLPIRTAMSLFDRGNVGATPGAQPELLGWLRNGSPNETKYETRKREKRFSPAPLDRRSRHTLGIARVKRRSRSSRKLRAGRVASEARPDRKPWGRPQKWPISERYEAWAEILLDEELRAVLKVFLNIINWSCWKHLRDYVHRDMRDDGQDFKRALEFQSGCRARSNDSVRQKPFASLERHHRSFGGRD